MVVLCPLIILIMSQASMSNFEFRSRGVGAITLTPAQQPVAGWILGTITLLLGGSFIWYFGRNSRRKSRIYFTPHTLVVSGHEPEAGDLVIPYDEITDIYTGERGDKSRLRVMYRKGRLEIASSRMESSQAFAELSALLEERVRLVRQNLVPS